MHFTMLAVTEKGLTEATKRYVEQRTRRGEIRPGTGNTLRYTLKGFVAATGEMRCSELSKQHIEQWHDGQRVAASTLGARLSQVRCFCLWLMQNDLITKDPTFGIKSPKPPRSVPRALKRIQVTSTYASCPDTRAELIVSLMVQEGLRCAEVAGLELGDIDFEEQLLLVREGKGGHQRVLPITDETLSTLDSYLAEHPAPNGPVIRSYNNHYRPISAAYVSTLVARWIRAGGTDATGHALRHTAATDMLRAGAHIRDVQNALGHVLLSTTQRYLPWVVGDLRQAMSGRRYRPSEHPASLDERRQVGPA